MTTLTRKICCPLCKWWAETQANSDAYMDLGEHMHMKHDVKMYRIHDVWKGKKRIKSETAIPMLKGRICKDSRGQK